MTVFKCKYGNLSSLKNGSLHHLFLCEFSECSLLSILDTIQYFEYAVMQSFTEYLADGRFFMSCAS